MITTVAGNGLSLIHICIKVSRFVILLKMIRREISHIVHPRSVNLIKLDGYKVDEDSIRSVTGFIILYVLILDVYKRQG